LQQHRLELPLLKERAAAVVVLAGVVLAAIITHPVQ